MYCHFVGNLGYIHYAHFIQWVNVVSTDETAMGTDDGIVSD